MAPIIFQALIKALDTACVLTALMILFIYAPTLRHMLREGEKGSLLLLGIVTTWIGMLFLYGDITVKLWWHEQAAASGLAPTASRLTYLTLVLTGGAIHIAAAGRHRYGVARSFCAWSLSIAAIVAVVVIHEVSPWAPSFSSSSSSFSSADCPLGATMAMAGDRPAPSASCSLCY